MKTSGINSLFSRYKYKEAYKNLSNETKEIINKISLLVTGRLKHKKIKTLTNLVEILNSLYFNHKKLPLKIEDILNRFEMIFKSPGQAIEFFLAYAINKKYLNQKKISIENGPEEIDGRDKIDFIIKYFFKDLNISIGNQLTLGGKFYNHESREIINNTIKRKILKSKLKLLNHKQKKGQRINNTISSRYDYDFLSFFHINNGISGEDIHIEGDKNNNPYLEAFNKYKKNNFNQDLINFLPLKIQTRLNDIGETIEIVLESFIKFLKYEKLEKEKIYKTINKWNYKIYIQYPTRKKLKIEDNEQAIYSLEFYITDKILKKLNIDITKVKNKLIRFIVTKK